MKTLHMRSTDLWSGILFVAIGAVALVASAQNVMGMILQMGPGYLPRALSIILVCLGLGLIIRSFWTKTSMESMQLKTAIPILTASVFFGLALQSLGLFLAATCTMLIASLSANTSLKKTVALAIACATIATVGAYALDLSMPLFPSIH